MTWVSVKDRLPEDNSIYYCVLSDGAKSMRDVAYFDEDEVWHDLTGLPLELEVTHWLPVPDLPKD